MRRVRRVVGRSAPRLPVRASRSDNVRAGRQSSTPGSRARPVCAIEPGPAAGVFHYIPDSWTSSGPMSSCARLQCTAATALRLSLNVRRKCPTGVWPPTAVVPPGNGHGVARPRLGRIPHGHDFADCSAGPGLSRPLQGVARRAPTIAPTTTPTISTSTEVGPISMGSCTGFVLTG